MTTKSDAHIRHLKGSYYVTCLWFFLVINQLGAQNFCFTISLFRSLYMFRAHVLIITSKLHYTASGIIKPIGGRLVRNLREEDDEHMCSKHVEATK